jgi:hypothetical protein
MTITSTDTRIAYAGDGATISFAVPYQFFGPGELRVIATTAGVDTPLERGVHYTVTGGSGTTGTVVATSAPAIGTTWTIIRATAQTQQLGLPNGGPLPGPSVERSLDRAMAAIQDNAAGLGRAIRIPQGEAADAPLLPAAAARAGKVLAFDSSGNPVASTITAGSVAISAPMEPVVGAASVALARFAIGARRHVDVVRDFGADNTNSSDASAAIQAAINSLTAGIVYFPPGVYGLAADITLKPQVMLEGDDPFLATLVARANSRDLLKYTAASATVGPFAVRRLGFSSGGFSNVRHIALLGTDAAKRISLVSLEDIYCGPGAVGVDMRWCANSRLESVKTNTTAIGIYIGTCADTEINGGWSQAGAAQGIYVIGGPGAYDEGLRITGYSTNGQAKGIQVDGQDWGQISNCSLTTATGGPLAFADSSNWKVSGTQLATGTGSPAAPGLTANATCVGIQVDNCLIALNTFGINLLGEQHMVANNRFTGNSNVDINLTATKCAIIGNICHSTGNAASIVEQAGSDYNNISGNTNNGTVAIVGANSKVNGENLEY